MLNTKMHERECSPLDIYSNLFAIFSMDSWTSVALQFKRMWTSWKEPEEEH